MELSPAQLRAISEAASLAVSAAWNQLAGPSQATDTSVAEIQGVEPLASGDKRMPSCVAHVSADSIRKIMNIEYVELATLLPSRSVGMEPPAKRFRVDENSADASVLISTVLTPRRKIENVTDWIEAWSIFSVIASEVAPGACAGLMERQLRVVQAAQKYRFAAVQEYDTRLRQAMSRDHSISIGNLHMELFTQSFTGQALPMCQETFYNIFEKNIAETQCIVCVLNACSRKTTKARCRMICCQCKPAHTTIPELQSKICTLRCWKTCCSTYKQGK